MKRRSEYARGKKGHFGENCDLLLKLDDHIGCIEEATRTTFTAEELKMATNNYDKILSEGSNGIVYHGVLSDQQAVAVKMFKSSGDEFVNEVILLSKIKHRNVVRVLGCCLETPKPFLVYEFMTNGTLYDHIHNRWGESSLSWQLRMKIAAETARALAFLHSSISMPIIIHRGVKSINILLDDNYTAKVSGFGISLLIGPGETATEVLHGTPGYIDPEYLETNTLTEKSDVYSFGVVLLELLTSRKAISFGAPVEEKNLATLFLCSVKDGRLDYILDQHLLKDERNIKGMKKVAEIAIQCLRLTREERPSMKQVAMRLEALRIMTRNPELKLN